MNATLGQEIEMELWDYDPGFPGVQNDDFLGRCGGCDKGERKLCGCFD